AKCYGNRSPWPLCWTNARWTDPQGQLARRRPWVTSLLRSALRLEKAARQDLARLTMSVIGSSLSEQPALIYLIQVFFDRCFAIVRAKMCGPSAGANHVVRAKRIKPGAKAVCSRRGFPVVANEVVNENFARRYRRRDLENILHLALGHHGSI